MKRRTRESDINDYISTEQDDDSIIHQAKKYRTEEYCNDDDDEYSIFIPTDCLLLIFEYCDAQSIFAAIQVCSTWRTIIDTHEQSLWKAICHSDFLMLQHVLFDNGTIQWKTLYSICPKVETCYSITPLTVQKYLVRWVCNDTDLVVPSCIAEALVNIDEFCENKQMTQQKLYSLMNNTIELEDSYQLIMSKINPIFNIMYLKTKCILNLVEDDMSEKVRDECIEYFEKSPAPSLNRLMATFYSERINNSKDEKVFDDLECLKRLDPSISPLDYIHTKALLLERLKRFEEAIIELDKCIEFNPKNSVYYMQKGLCLDNINKHEEAVELVTRALLMKLTPGTYIVRAQAYESLERYEAAYNDTQYAIALDPSYIIAYVDRARYLYRLKRYTEALQEYDRLLADRILIIGELLEVYNRKAYTLVELTRYDEALHNVERALDLNPSARNVILSKGEILCLLQRYEESIEWYTKAIEATNDSYAYYRRSLSYFAMDKNLEQALEDAKQACLLDPKNTQFKQYLETLLQLLTIK
jgi:tetratricopeptide (TPR) repeat protein